MKNILSILTLFFFTTFYILASESEDSIELNKIKQITIAGLSANVDLIIEELSEEDSTKQHPTIQLDGASEGRNYIDRWGEISISEESERQIHSYVARYLISNEKLPEQNWKRNIRVCTKVLALLIGGTAGIPYVNAACEIVKNPYLCAAFGTGVIVAYGSAASWIALRLASHLDPISDEERFFQNSTTCSKLSHIIPNTLGIIAALPDFYYLYKYNEIKFLAVQGFLVSYTFKSQGFYELIEIISNFRKSCCQNNVQERGGGRSMAEITHNEIILPLFSSDHRANDVNHIKEEVVGKLTTVIEKNWPTHDFVSVEWEHKNKLRKAFQALSFMFPLGSLLVNGSIALEGLKLFLPSPWYYPALAFVMTPGFIMDTVITSMTIGEIFDVSYNKIIGNYNTDYIKSYYPLLSYMIPCSALFFATLSGGGDAVVAHDIISNSTIINESFLANLKNILPFIMMGSSIIFESYTGNDLGKRLIKQIDMYMCNTHKSELLRIENHLETVANLFEAREQHEQHVLNTQNSLLLPNVSNRDIEEEEDDGVFSKKRCSCQIF